MNRRKSGIFAVAVGVLFIVFAAVAVIFNFPGIDQGTAKGDAVVGLVLLAVGIIQIKRAV